MRQIAIAAVALNQTPLDWTGNSARISQALAEARRRGSALVCLPELCLTGYGCEDAFFAPSTAERAWAELQALLPRTQGMVVGVGLPILHGRALFNTSALCVDGRVVGLAAKRHLAGDGIHYEPRWFKPWPAGFRDDWRSPDGTSLPLGDLLFEVGGVRVGFEICEDAWVADRPGADLADLGADVLLNPSASHFAFGKSQVRRRFVVEGSRAFGCAYVYSNLLGNEAGRVIYDGQLLVANAGSLVAESPRFSFAPWTLLPATVDLSLGRLSMVRRASFVPVLPQAGGVRSVSVPFAWPDGEEPGSAPLPSIDTPADCDDKHEEFTLAVALGLYDYRRKSGTTGYVVSLSGGADSAAVACLVRLMFDLARNELGTTAFPEDLEFSRLLATAFQATEHSGSASREAARVLAAGLGCAHHEFDLQELHQGYLELVGRATGVNWDWKDHDIPLQNIQARLRAPGIWMLANLRNAILLTTSNRSEAAVGYATMDGDTAGGLAPISGIDKAFLREWLRWLEAAGPRVGSNRRPIPELSQVNARDPTAELRPASAAQTDADDLMPYPVLDFIERAFIRDQRSPEETLLLLGQAFPETDPSRHGTWVRRFHTLWRRNQWKRERYAPGFHLDDENLDPKTWCRWPILSGPWTEAP